MNYLKNNKLKTIKAMTLIEIIVVLFIFTIVIFMILECFIFSMRNYRLTEQSSDNFNKATIAFDRMMRDFQTLNEIYVPADPAKYQQDDTFKGYFNNELDSKANSSYKPGFNGRPPFVFKMTNQMDFFTSQQMVVAYTIDYNTNSLIRMEYDPLFNPNTPDDTRYWRNVSKYTWKLSSNVRDLGIQYIVKNNFYGANRQFMYLYLSILTNTDGNTAPMKVPLGTVLTINRQ